MSPGRQVRPWVFAIGVAIVTVVVFIPALSNGFVNWDDDKNFINNPDYRGLGWENLRWMWTTFHLGHYTPLTWMTLGADYSLWGMRPFGYHLTSVLLHAATAALCFLVALRLLRGPEGGEPVARTTALVAAFAALAFSVHPLRVESVAWATERRDVLSGLFYFGAIFAWLRHADTHDRRWYAGAIAAFACAILSKASSVTLPAVLLVLAVYPLRRIDVPSDRRKAIRDLVPFALLALVGSALAFKALQEMPQLPVDSKLAVSAYSLAFYVWKTLAPVGLSPLYPMPAVIDPFSPVFIAAYAAVAAVTLASVVLRSRFPLVPAAWLAFSFAMLPMLGLHQNGMQIAADRYTYNAAPALAIAAAAALMHVARRRAALAAAAGSVVIVALAVATWRQQRVWRDTTALWERAVAVDDRSFFSQNALGGLHLERGDLDRAVRHFSRSLEFAPEYAQAHNGLGAALSRKGRHDEAIPHFAAALRSAPTYDEPANNWGIALAAKGDLRGAIARYAQALAINPNNADTHMNLGNAYVRLDRAAEALSEYAESIRIRPDSPLAHFNWGVALARLGRFREAIMKFEEVLRLQPDNADARAFLEQARKLATDPEKGRPPLGG